MKWILSIFIIFTLIFNCLCQSQDQRECVIKRNIKDYSESSAIEDDDKVSACRAAYTLSNTGATHCCLFTFENSINQCGGVTDDQYEHIKEYKKYLNNFVYSDLVVKKIKCGSHYLTYSLFAITILALIF